MGIINHGILGGIKGSVGNVSGQKSKGRNVLTIKPDMSNVVKSSIQVVNNDKFNVLRKLYLNSNETINKITCANNPFKEAGYNFFSRKNYDNLTSDNIVSVDNVFIGNSGLPRVQILTAKYNSAKTKLTVTYSTSTFNVYGASSKTYCCLYDATNVILYCLPTNYNFFSGTFIIDLPINHTFDFNNLYVSVIASSNTDPRKFSNTLNNWILSTKSITGFEWLYDTLSFSYDSPIFELIENSHCVGIDFLNQQLNTSNYRTLCVEHNHQFWLSVFLVNSLTGSNLKTFVNYNDIRKYVNINILPKSILLPCTLSQYILCRTVSRSASSSPYSSDNYSFLGTYSTIEYVSSNVSWIHPFISGNRPCFNWDENLTGRTRTGYCSFKLLNQPTIWYLWIVQRF